jgi:HK97 family phage prohead protease
MKHKSFRLASFKALDDAKGIFEAIVAVFNNVDRAGDKILPGAFRDSLADWEAKGRPIPVIFAHQWDNLDAHIGQVLEAKEVPDGLFVKGQLEMDEPFAARVWKKMLAGTLAEFSFAYDIVEAAQVKADGEWIQELRKLSLLEVGPCLVGMNPDTQLLGVKEGRRNATKDAERIQRIHDLTVDLGAKCAEPSEDEGPSEGEAGKSGKPSGKGPSTIATRIALELLEAGVG